MARNTYSIFLVFTDDTDYSLLEPLNTRKRTIVAALGYSVDLNCQVNDPSVDVHLIQEDHERAPDGIKITKSGQIFTINNVEESDEGTYHCKAQSTFLKIERIFTANYSKTKGDQFVCNNYVKIMLISYFSTWKCLRTC